MFVAYLVFLVQKMWKANKDTRNMLGYRGFFKINLIHTSVSLATSIGTLHTDDIRTKTRLEHNNIGILISIFCKNKNY